MAPGMFVCLMRRYPLPWLHLLRPLGLPVTPVLRQRGSRLEQLGPVSASALPCPLLGSETVVVIILQIRVAVSSMFDVFVLFFFCPFCSIDIEIGLHCVVWCKPVCHF
jgi:hypothetical protein